MSNTESNESESLRRDPSIFLCLSGGGLRATIFHYGCIKRLHEMGLLSHVYAISATSGGAIIAAMLMLYFGDPNASKRRFQFHWEDFERAFLAIARRGLIARTALAAVIRFSYLAIAIMLMASLAHWIWSNIIPFSIETSISIQAPKFPFWPLTFLLTVLALHLVYGVYTFLVQWTARCETRSRMSLKRWCADVMMVFRPARVRIETMQDMIFKKVWGMKDIHHLPWLYINSVDLNSGLQYVFSQNTTKTLDKDGCKSLFRDEDASAQSGVRIAEAVGASSAIPPIFKSLPVSDRQQLLGVFVDGGVADNQATNIITALSSFHNEQTVNGQRVVYGTAEGFRRATSFVLVADAGQQMGQKNKKSWTRVFSLFRLFGTILNQQGPAAKLVPYNLETNVTVASRMIGVQAGLPSGVRKTYPFTDKNLSNIRTHLDSFGLQEIAVLAYAGYRWVDEALLDVPSVMSQYENVSAAPLLSFENILPTFCGSWSATPSDVEAAIQRSISIISLARTWNNFLERRATRL